MHDIKLTLLVNKLLSACYNGRYWILVYYYVLCTLKYKFTNVFSKKSSKIVHFSTLHHSIRYLFFVCVESRRCKGALQPRGDVIPPASVSFIYKKI